MRRGKFSIIEWADLATMRGRRAVPNKLRIRVETVLRDRELRRIIRESSQTELDRLGGARGSRWLDDVAASARLRRWTRAYRKAG